MARSQDLMGLGLPPFLANVMSQTPIFTSAAGATVAAATQLTAQNKTVVISTGTSGVKVPQVGGDNGALPGDEMRLINSSAASIVLYAALSLAGSTVVFWADNASTAGTTGLSMSSGISWLTYPITTSVWLVIKNVASV